VPTRIIDLSLPLDHEMNVHHEDPRIGFVNFARIATHGCNMTQLLLSTHGGTHMDAPRHFIDDGRSIDDVDLTKCIGRAIVFDGSGPAGERDLLVSDLRPFQEKIRPGTRLLLRTDWYKWFPDMRYYTGFFGVSVELAEWLADRDIALIGVETPAIHPKDYERVHKVFLSKNICIVEGLANLDKLKSSEVFFSALPLRLRGLDGSPIRAVAIEGGYPE
jgi:arylformamidase